MCALPIGPPARLHEYSLKQLSLDEDTLDGPFFMSNGQFGLLVSLRGKDGGALPSCSELRWSRDLPPAARSAPLQIFVRQKNGMLALGPAQIARRGQLTRDGYKVALAFAEPLPAALWSHLVEAALRPLAPAPEELIATLTTSSTTSERIAAMRMFAARWFNCPADAQPLAHELPLPLPLRTLYALVAEHPVDAQNQLVAATALVVEDDRIAFYIENQGVCSWATSVAADDPPVYV
nr:hypothetical protein [Kofleriaceae bacterium]